MDNQNGKPLENLGDILRAGAAALSGKADQASDYIDQALKNVQIPDSLKSGAEDLAVKGGEALKNLDIPGALSSLRGAISGALGDQDQNAEAGHSADTEALNLVLKALEHMDHGQLAMVRNKIDSLINRIG